MEECDWNAKRENVQGKANAIDSFNKLVLRAAYCKSRGIQIMLA